MIKHLRMKFLDQGDFGAGDEGKQDPISDPNNLEDKSGDAGVNKSEIEQRGVSDLLGKLGLQSADDLAEIAEAFYKKLDQSAFFGGAKYFRPGSFS